MSVRGAPTPVGVALTCVHGGDLASSSSNTRRPGPTTATTTTTTATTGGDSPVFVPSIMHRAVSTRGFDVTVLVRATPEQIAKHLDADVQAADVASFWLGEGDDLLRGLAKLPAQERHCAPERLPIPHHKLSACSRHAAQRLEKVPWEDGDGDVGRTPEMSEVEDGEGGASGRRLRGGAGGGGCARCEDDPLSAAVDEEHDDGSCGGGVGMRREGSPVGSSLSSCGGLEETFTSVCCAAGGRSGNCGGGGGGGVGGGGGGARPSAAASGAVVGATAGAADAAPGLGRVVGRPGDEAAAAESAAAAVAGGVEEGRRDGGSESGMSALGRGRFDDLFVEKVEPRHEIIVFANQLIDRLTKLLPQGAGAGEVDAPAKKEPDDVVVVRWQPSDRASTSRPLSHAPHQRLPKPTAPIPIARSSNQTRSTSTSSATTSSTSRSSTGCYGDDESTTPEHPSTAGEAHARCGFGEAHPAVKVMCEGLAICKTGKGLYRTALGAGAARRDVTGGGAVSDFYFETHVVEDCDGHGMTIGFATDSLPLDKQIGFDTSSAGLHSSGKLVCGNGNFEDFADRGFGKMDRVGVRLSYICGDTSEGGCKGEQSMLRADPPASLTDEGAVAAAAAAAAASGLVVLEFYVNGSRIGARTLPLAAGAGETGFALRPAVSLYRTDSKAVIRCCRADWEREDKTAASCCGCR